MAAIKCFTGRKSRIALIRHRFRYLRPAAIHPKKYEQKMKIADSLPGDGIGTEIVAEAVKVLNVANDQPRFRDGIRSGGRRRL